MEPIAPAIAAWKNLALIFEAISFIWSMFDPNINSTESCKVSLSLGNWPFAFMFAVDERLIFILAFFLKCGEWRDMGWNEGMATKCVILSRNDKNIFFNLDFRK